MMIYNTNPDLAMKICPQSEERFRFYKIVQLINSANTF